MRIEKYQKVKQNHNTLVLHFTTESQIKYAEHPVFEKVKEVWTLQIF